MAANADFGCSQSPKFILANAVDTTCSVCRPNLPRKVLWWHLLHVSWSLLLPQFGPFFCFQNLFPVSMLQIWEEFTSFMMQRMRCLQGSQLCYPYRQLGKLQKKSTTFGILTYIKGNELFDVQVFITIFVIFLHYLSFKIMSMCHNFRLHFTVTLLQVSKMLLSHFFKLLFPQTTR